MKTLLASLILVGFVVAGDPVTESIVKKHIAASASAPDILETVYMLPDGRKLVIREETVKESDGRRSVPCEVAGNTPRNQIKKSGPTEQCECGAACDCDGCRCKPGYKCDSNGCKALPKRTTELTADIPVVTSDGKVYRNKAEYEATLSPKIQASPPLRRSVGAGLSVQIGNRLFNINADMGTETACKSINEIFVANPGTVTFYSNGTVVQTPTWYTPVSGFTQATIAPSVGGSNMWSRQNMQTAYTPMYVMPAAPGGGTPARGYAGPTRYNGGQPPLFGASFGVSGPFGGGFRMSGGLGGCTTGG